MQLFEWQVLSQGYVYFRPYEYRLYSDETESRFVHISFHQNQNVWMKKFVVDYTLSRDPKEGPAYESFYVNGVTRRREFRVDGAYSRPIEFGPAVQHFDSSGNLIQQEYWVNGVKLPSLEAR